MHILPGKFSPVRIVKNQIKAGKTEVGSQRYRCKIRKRRYAPQPKQQVYPDDMRQQALRLYLAGMNLRRTGRHLGVDYKTVSQWVKAYATQLGAAPCE